MRIHAFLECFHGSLDSSKPQKATRTRKETNNTTHGNESYSFMTSIGFVTWGNPIPPLSHFCLSVRNNSFTTKQCRVNAVWHGTTFKLLNWGCFKCFRLYPTGSKIGILLATLHLSQQQEDVSLLNLTHTNQTILRHHVLAQEVALSNKRGRFQLQQFPSFERLLPKSLMLLPSVIIWDLQYLIQGGMNA